METLSRDYLLGLSTINPEYEEASLGTHKFHRVVLMDPKLANKAPAPEALNVNSDIFKFRAKLASMRAVETLPTSANYEEEDRQIPVRDGACITVRIHRPKKPPVEGSPVFVVYHGGGFVFGDLDSEAVLCRQWVELGGVAVNVDYRLAPEHPFPGPVHDAFDALKWVRKF
jgi:acetyl esterase/lipase